MQITVNGEIIPNEQYEMELGHSKTQNPQMIEADLRELVKNNIIDRTIIRQAANKLQEPLALKRIEDEFTKLLAANGGREQFYSRYRLTPEDDKRIKKDIENSLLVTDFLENLTKGLNPPDEEKIKEYYESNKEQFIVPEEIHAAHIVRQPNRSNPSIAYNELLEIRNKLLKGENFAAVADVHSQCNDAGGDLGFFSRGKMVDEFETVVFSMNSGEVSPIFQTQFGYHVATVYEKNPSRKKTFEEAKSEISEKLLYDIKNDFIGLWVDKEKEKAEIKVL